MGFWQICIMFLCLRSIFYSVSDFWWMCMCFLLFSLLHYLFFFLNNVFAFIVDCSSHLLFMMMQEVSGKVVEIHITGFMKKNTGKFMKALWTLLLSAQKNASGVPQQFVDTKEEEIRKKKLNMSLAVPLVLSFLFSLFFFWLLGLLSYRELFPEIQSLYWIDSYRAFTFNESMPGKLPILNHKYKAYIIFIQSHAYCWPPETKTALWVSRKC